MRHQVCVCLLHHQQLLSPPSLALLLCKCKPQPVGAGDDGAGDGGEEEPGESLPGCLSVSSSSIKGRITRKRRRGSVEKAGRETTWRSWERKRETSSPLLLSFFGVASPEAGRLQQLSLQPSLLRFVPKVLPLFSRATPSLMQSSDSACCQEERRVRSRLALALLFSLSLLSSSPPGVLVCTFCSFSG